MKPADLKPAHPIRVTLGGWDACRAQAAPIRYDVFVREQHVPAEIELDAEDAECTHAVAFDESGVALATGRLSPAAHIGRMAVRASHRGMGVGSRVLMALMDEARRRGDARVVLSAQTHARAFYAAHGFVAFGSVFMEAGIEHIAMYCDLDAISTQQAHG